MPFPGSQYKETLSFAYWLSNNILWLRVIGLAIIAWPAIHLLRNAKSWKKIFLIGVIVLYGVIFYLFNFQFLADKMFYQPTNKTFATAANNSIPANKLILGITLNGQSKAYPIQLIGYHHQVRDTVGNTPVMVTYCTVCRTGRVFSPLVNDQNETFRLVGMDHFNAMFEDATTKSWWQQATGIAVAGPLKGKRLNEIPSTQMSLSAWVRQHPGSLIMQPDMLYKKEYDHLDAFDKGIIKSSLEKRDSASWQFKSWVVGIAHGKNAKAYDWNALVNSKLIEDSLPGLPLVMVLEPDSITFHAWNRNLNGQVLHFTKDSSSQLIRDHNTQSAWNMDGICIEGPLKGNVLSTVQASQEFWHSWRTFHPATER